MKLSNLLESVAEEHRFKKLHRRNFSNGLVAMMRAMEKGQDVGIITARSSKEGNEAIIKLIERFTKKSIKYKFFVNDPVLSKELEGSTTPLKKLQLLIEFRNGLGQAPKKYSKVKIFDDEDLNLEAVKDREKFVAELGFKKNVKLDNIKAYDINKWDFNRLDAEITQSKNSISFFDLDGTIIHTDAKIHIVDKETGENFTTMTQAEFAVRGQDIMDQIRKQKPNAIFDLSDFFEKDKINKQATVKAIKRPK